MKNLFKTIIKDFHAAGIPVHKKRDLSVPINSGKIVNIIGSRRAGKTFYFFQLIDHLLKSTSIENIIYVNFEDERLSTEAKDLQYLVDAYFELYPEQNSPLFFFFDEIQYITGWEKFVRRLYDTVSKNIFLTGSSSKLLNKEIAYSLRGRSITYELFPLSFSEYLRFINVEISNSFSTRQKSIIQNKFERYLTGGGFPELVSAEEQLKPRIFQSYFEVMIYRDIIERYKIASITSLKIFIKKCMANTSNKLSINKLFNELKSQGVKTSKDTLYLFTEYVQDCYLLFLVNKYSESLSIQSVSDKKIYCIDNGLANAVSFKFSEDRGRMLENLVFLEMKRRGEEVYYYSNKVECDFVVSRKNKIVQAVQVTKALHSGNIEREIAGVSEAIKVFDLECGLILTEEDASLPRGIDVKIEIKPVWRWLLESSG